MTIRPPTTVSDPLPMPITIAEAWHIQSDAEAEIGEDIRDAALDSVAIAQAREETVTLEIVGSNGLAYHAYELDLTPAGADELALWLIRRAEEARAEIRTRRREGRRTAMYAGTRSVDPAEAPTAGSSVGTPED